MFCSELASERVKRGGKTHVVRESQHQSFDDGRVAVGDCDVQTRLVAVLVRLVLGQHQLSVAAAHQEIDDCRVVVQQSDVQNCRTRLTLAKVTMTQLDAALLQ